MVGRTICYCQISESSDGLSHLCARKLGYLEFSSNQWRDETSTESCSSLHLRQPLQGGENSWNSLLAEGVVTARSRARTNHEQVLTPTALQRVSWKNTFLGKNGEEQRHHRGKKETSISQGSSMKFLKSNKVGPTEVSVTLPLHVLISFTHYCGISSIHLMIQ